jgi:hypothetical protein
VYYVLAAVCSGYVLSARLYSSGFKNVVIIDVDNKDNDLHNVDKSDIADVDTDSENGDPEQPIIN